MKQLLGLLVLVGVFVHYFWVIAATAAVVLLMWGLTRWWRHLDAEVHARRAWAAELAARADYEHRAYMRGDVAVGVHGAYPPAC